jgi:hypothetical protein
MDKVIKRTTSEGSRSQFYRKTDCAQERAWRAMKLLANAGRLMSRTAAAVPSCGISRWRA